jgi:hypothetical protein
MDDESDFPDSTEVFFFFIDFSLVWQNSPLQGTAIHSKFSIPKNYQL